MKKSKSYAQMYSEAAKYLNSHGGYYKGYTDGNALSLYVNDKYSVNAADNSSANDALCDAMSLLD